MNKVVAKTVFLIAMSALVFSILSLYLARLRLTPFFVDEYHFMRKAYYFNLFFVDKNTSDTRFYTEFEAAQPKIGIYIYGASLYLSGVKDVNSFLNKYELKNWSKSVGPLMTSLGGTQLARFPQNMSDFVEIVIHQRKISIFFSLMAFLLIFLIAGKILGHLYAFIATFVVSINTLVVTTNTVATTDSMLMFFTFAAFIISLKLLEVSSHDMGRPKYIYFVLLGICMAFGAGVKVTGIIILFYILSFFTVMVWSNRHKKETRTHLLNGFAVTLISFFATFIYFHPFLYKNTIENFLLMFVGRYKGIADAQLQNTMADVPTRLQALELIIKETLLPGGLYINFHIKYIPFDLVLFLSGGYLLIKNSLTKYKINKSASPELFMLILFVLTFVGLIFYLKVNWPRYFMQTEILISMIQCYSVALVMLRYSKLVIKLKS